MALRMLQNISASKVGKRVLVNSFAFELLSISAWRTEAEEQKTAMAALFNLSTDPGCLMAHYQYSRCSVLPRVGGSGYEYLIGLSA